MSYVLNGKIILNASEAIYPDDRGFLLGDGLFETIKSINGTLMHFKAHYDRLKKSAQVLGIQCNITQQVLHDLCDNILLENKLTQGDASLRITLTRGRAARGIDISQDTAPTLLITASTYPSHSDNSIRLCVTSIKRSSESPVTQHKTLNYLEPVLARKEARERGFDDGIMLNTNRMITEGTVSNIFFVKEDRVVTPSLKDGVLPGIMRGIVIDICKSAGINVMESSIAPSEQSLSAFQAVFLTNSLSEIQGVSSINNLKFQQKIKNSLVLEIISLYEKLKIDYIAEASNKK